MTADNTNTTQYSSALAPCSSNGMVAIYSSLTKAEAFEANDTVTMCKLPAGYKVVAFAINIDKKIGDATSTFKLGTMSDSTSIDDDSLVGATACTAATTLVAPALTPTSYGAEANARVVLTIAAVGANASSDCTVRLVVWATPYTV